mmetsp:Transcript_1206/g.3160  ORF Transcript_1206/g.3160 Transcript_1206/m.3160 type:complete len:85 (+) Transcript_1206:105-359(+)
MHRRAHRDHHFSVMPGVKGKVNWANYRLSTTVTLPISYKSDASAAQVIIYNFVKEESSGWAERERTHKRGSCRQRMPTMNIILN